LFNTRIAALRQVAFIRKKAQGMKTSKLQSLAILALALPASAQAANVANSIVGCKAKAGTQTVAEFMAKNDNAGLEKLKTAKIKAGDCSFLSKGMAITIDKKDGQYLCVRPSGGLDCFWAPAIAINQNPTEPEKTPASRSRSQGRGWGRHSPF
jgi:hypothetical protein